MIAFHHHAKKVVHHIQKHHQKYLLFWGVASSVFVAAKIFLFFTASFVLYNGAYDLSFAQNLETGSVDTGTVTSETLSGTILSWAQATTESTGTILTGNTQTGTVVVTGDTQTWTVQNTGTVVVVETGTVQTWSTQTTGTVQNTGTNQQTTPQSVTCQSGDYLMSTVLSGMSFSGMIPFQWSLSGSCVAPSSLSFQLYDHNNQWIEIGQLTGGSRSLSMDSIKLFSGRYSVTGLNMSGLVTTLYTGIYLGVPSSFWTGYKVRIVDGQSIVYQSSTFTVDHKVPTLSGLILSSSGYSSGVVGVAAPIKIAFDASEALSWVRITVASGQAALFNLSGLHYEYGIIMSGGQPTGPITYTISFADIAGNTWTTISWTSLFTFDKTFPVISGLTITGSVGKGISVSYTTSEAALSTVFATFHGTTTWWILRGATYATTHSFVFTSLSTGSIYDIGVSFADVAGNLTKVALLLGISSTWSLQSSWVATVYGTDVQRALLESTATTTASTGIVLSGSTIGSALDLVKKEILKFNDCRDRIAYTPIKLKIKGNEFNLTMPDFKKSEVRKIVNAFSYYMVQKLDKDWIMKQTELDEITKKFDSFLVILKLVKDDDNSCKQNLSNYHIRQFKETMETYGILGL